MCLLWFWFVLDFAGVYCCCGLFWIVGLIDWFWVLGVWGGVGLFCGLEFCCWVLLFCFWLA